MAPEITVPAGTTITWTNTGQRPHTATDRSGTFDTNPIVPGATASVTLTAPGRYFYFCRINPNKMNGVVTVQPGGGPAPVQRIQALDPAREGEQLGFDPSQLTVPVGGAIELGNVGGVQHTRTADDGSFDTGLVDPGAEKGRFAGNNASIRLATPGTFAFHCEIHPRAMRGVLTVVGQEEQANRPPPEVAAPPGTVKVVDFGFDPVEVSVQPSAEVIWQNTGNTPHTGTFDDVQLDTGRIEPGAEGRLTAPTQPGSYSYFCAVHPQRMRGVLVVVHEASRIPSLPGGLRRPGARPRPRRGRQQGAAACSRSCSPPA